MKSSQDQGEFKSWANQYILYDFQTFVIDCGIQDAIQDAIQNAIQDAISI